MYEQLYKTLQPGDTFNINTYDGHPWVVRDSVNNNEVMKIMARGG